MNVGGGLGNVLGASAVILNTGDNSQNTDDSKKTGMIVGIVLGATFLVCLSIVGSVFYMRKRAKITQFTS